MQLSVRPLDGQDRGGVEVVEHKGLGHPDTICDALAEDLSQSLCRFYLDHFGAVLHHNVDKALLCGGSSRPAFGGGEISVPIEVFLAGRATTEARGVVVPVEELAIEGSRRWLREHLHALDPVRDVRIHSLVRPGSTDLVELFARRARERVWLANDTSLGVGYAPLSELERIVLAVSRLLRELAREGAEVGEDIKIMGVRTESRVTLTVACAFVGRFVADLGDYVAKKALLGERVAAAARRLTAREVLVRVNAADDIDRSSIYLTVSGTSAEAGDDGQVGRGNRVNGLITPYRPMVLEAAAGKNPMSHVGKLYSVAAHGLAAEIVEKVGAIAEAHCLLLSEIGSPVEQPRIVDVRVRSREGGLPGGVLAEVEAIARDSIARIGELAERLIRGELAVY